MPITQSTSHPLCKGNSWRIKEHHFSILPFCLFKVIFSRIRSHGIHHHLNRYHFGRIYLNMFPNIQHSQIYISSEFAERSIPEPDAKSNQSKALLFWRIQSFLGNISISILPNLQLSFPSSLLFFKWLVNLPSLTYPSRYKALLRAY